MNKDQAVDKLVHTSHQDLYELCYWSHLDQYGVTGQILSNYTRAELVSWYILHYDWNQRKQRWESILPQSAIASRIQEELTAEEEQRELEKLFS